MSPQAQQMGRYRSMAGGQMPMGGPAPAGVVPAGGPPMAAAPSPVMGMNQPRMGAPGQPGSVAQPAPIAPAPAGRMPAPWTPPSGGPGQGGYQRPMQQGVGMPPAARMQSQAPQVPARPQTMTPNVANQDQDRKTNTF